MGTMRDFGDTLQKCTSYSYLRHGARVRVKGPRRPLRNALTRSQSWNSSIIRNFRQYLSIPDSLQTGTFIKLRNVLLPWSNRLHYFILEIEISGAHAHYHFARNLLEITRKNFTCIKVDHLNINVPILFNDLDMHNVYEILLYKCSVIMQTFIIKWLYGLNLQNIGHIPTYRWTMWTFVMLFRNGPLTVCDSFN